MARPERNNVDYFPLYCDEGKKMFYLEETYGNDGFATFIKILRELAKTDYHYLDLSKNTTKMFLSAKCKISKETLESIIKDLVDLEKFDSVLWNENSIIWCQDFVDSIQDAYKKRNNECISYGGLLLHLTSLGIRKQSKSISKGHVNPQRKEKDIKEKEIKENNFNIFWDKYPKKIGKKDCLDKWLKLKEDDISKILETIDTFVNYKPFDTYTHPNPSTYLNQQRWNDEIKKETFVNLGNSKVIGRTNQSNYGN